MLKFLLMAVLYVLLTIWHEIRGDFLSQSAQTKIPIILVLLTLCKRLTSYLQNTRQTILSSLLVTGMTKNLETLVRELLSVSLYSTAVFSSALCTYYTSFFLIFS